MFVQTTISKKAVMPSALDTEKERRENKGAFRFVKVTFARSELPGGSRNRGVFFLQKSLGVGDAARRASQHGVMAPGRSQPSYQDSLHSQNAGRSLRLLRRETSPLGVSVPRAPFKS